MYVPMRWEWKNKRCMGKYLPDVSYILYLDFFSYFFGIKETYVLLWTIWVQSFTMISWVVETWNRNKWTKNLSFKFITLVKITRIQFIYVPIIYTYPHTSNYTALTNNFNKKKYFLSWKNSWIVNCNVKSRLQFILKSLPSSNQHGN